MKHEQESENVQNTVLLGAAVAAIGAAVAVLIVLQPEGLAVPMWVAMLACLSFVFAGGAMAMPPDSRPILRHCMVLALLATMTLIPAWISFGPGDRHCSSNLPFFNGETSCRLVFGFSTVCMLIVLAIAVKQMWQLIQSRS